MTDHSRVRTLGRVVSWMRGFESHRVHTAAEGTAGLEPATAGSAIPCSTAELSTHEVGMPKSNRHIFF